MIKIEAMNSWKIRLPSNFHEVTTTCKCLEKMGNQVEPQVTPKPPRSPCGTPPKKSQGTPVIEICSVTPHGTPDIEISIAPEHDSQYVSEIITISTYNL